MTNPNSRIPWTFHVGDAKAVLAGMPDQSANCIVTGIDLSPGFACLAAVRLAQAVAGKTEDNR